MRCKPKPAMSYYRLHGVMVVAAVASMTYVNAVSANDDFTRTLSEPQRASFGSPLDDSQVHRHLRNHTATMTDAANKSSEDRSFGEFLSNTNYHFTMVMQNLEKLVNALMPTATLEQQVDQLFKSKLLFNKGQLFDLSSQRYRSWKNAVERLYQGNVERANIAMVQTMATYYGDSNLATMLIAARNSPTMKNLATSLEEAQLENWLVSNKNAGDVFKLLKLDQTDGVVFENPLIMTWISFVVKFDKENHLKLIWSVLLDHCKDEAELAKMLVQAKSFPVTKDLAAREEEALLNKWLEESLTLGDVFQRLKIRETDDVSIENPLMYIWASYAMRLDEENYSELMWSVLLDHCKDEAELAKMLVQAKSFPVTKDLAAREEEALLNKWLEESLTLGDVFQRLKIRETNDMSIENPLMYIWASYAMRLDEENYSKLMWSVLLDHYKDEAELAKMLIKAKESPKYKDLATSLEKAQIDDWISKPSYVDVFKLFKLDQADDLSFEDPLMKVWISYLEKKYPKDYDESIIYALFLSNKGDAASAKILARAKNFPATSKLATEAENDRLNWWLKMEFDVRRAFETLGLPKTNGILFENPLIETWTSYAKLFDEESHIKLMWLVLQDFYKDKVKLAEMLIQAKESPKSKDLATSLEEAQINDWVSSGKDAADVFKLLKLDQADDVFLDDPLVKVWASFVVKLDEKNHIKLVLSVLKNHYKDEVKLAEMLNQAKEFPKSKDLATSLEEAQINDWVSSGKDAAGVFKLLKLSQVNDLSLEDPLVKVWVSFVVKLDEKNHIKLVLSVLQDFYKDEAKLAKMLNQAKEFPKTENLATNLQEAQIIDWVSSGNDATSIFELLELDQLDNVSPKHSNS